jgi:hypothetical protein
VRAIVAAAFGTILVSVASGAATPPPASAGVSSGELDQAIALFARFNPQLLRPNRPARLAGRLVAPGFSPLIFIGEPSIRELSTHLTGTLVSGELGELDMYLADETGTTTFEVPHHPALSGPRAYDFEALVNSVAFIEGGVEPHTDVLVRPTPFGYSVYVQFRSANSPERFSIHDKVSCAPVGSELIRRLRPGTFSVELLLGERKAECEPYSRTPVAPAASIEPSDTVANYAHERRLIALARERARRDDADALALVSARPARDARGRLVPTEMAWRYEEEPVLRVHLRAGRYRYPVLARVDFFSGAR